MKTSFVEISDSHLGFNKEANKDVTGTLKEAIANMNALPNAPSFMLHTGDLSHLAEPEEFDTLEQSLKDRKTRQVFYVPGEHDVLNDNVKQYRERFGKDSKGSGWYSFDQKRFGSVTVLNGHIHQIIQKVEGTITFHTAMSTAFPQPQPGTAPKAGPMKVLADKLRSVLGVTSVKYVQGNSTLAVVDSRLSS